MQLKIIFIISFIFLLILLIIFFLPLKQKTVYVKGGAVRVEIADNSFSQFKGLSFRDELCPDCGMLFVYDKMAPRTFTMRGMKFPLDFIWIQDSEIVQIDKMIKPAGEDQKTPLIKGARSNYVLEVIGGYCDRYNIKAGDRVKIE